jgi:hypothetical protein
LKYAFPDLFVYLLVSNRIIYFPCDFYVVEGRGLCSLKPQSLKASKPQSLKASKPQSLKASKPQLSRHAHEKMRP